MNLGPKTAIILVVSADLDEARQVAEWLRGAGLGAIATARTCDEAMFLLGRGRPALLIIDESIAGRAEQRLLRHIGVGDGDGPPLVRLAGAQVKPAAGRAVAAGIIRKPLTAHDVVLRVGSAMQRPDLLGQLDQSSDQAARHLEAARDMQIGLLPTAAQLSGLQTMCGVGVAAFCRSGDAVGGDFWGIWPTGEGRFALAIADFAGHGLSAALNTFRLHALLSDDALPRGEPERMLAALNERLYALLPRGQYATMAYLAVDPAARQVAWCGAGAPPPLLISADRVDDLQARGLPLGIKPGTSYQKRCMQLPEAGILAVFSDGLFESGGQADDVPRAAMAEALAEPVGLAAGGDLAAAARQASARLEALRDNYPCSGHSDDIMAICVAWGRA